MKLHLPPAEEVKEWAIPRLVSWLHEVQFLYFQFHVSVSGALS